MKFVILFLLITLILLWENKGKSFYSIRLIVFLSSFVANPFLSYHIYIGLSGVLIWAVFLFKQLGLGSRSGSVISRNVYIIIIGLAIYGAFLGLSNINILKLTPFSESNLGQIINVTIFLSTIAVFIKISEKYFLNPITKSSLIKIFTFSVFFHLLADIFTRFKLSFLLPQFLLGEPTIMDELDKGLIGIVRSSGLIGDYELIVDFSIMVILFSSILIIQAKKNKDKCFSYCAIISSIAIGALSGTRSFFVVLIVIVILVFFLNLIFNRNNIKLLKMFGIFFILSLVLYQVFLKDLEIFQRLMFAFDLYRNGSNIEEASNRNFLPYLPEFFTATPYTGLGSFFFFSFYKNSLVSHNIYLAIYVKYGILGIILFIYLLLSLFIELLKLLLKCRYANTKIEIILLISFFIGLLFQEYKISAFRYFHTMLIYTIFFMVIYSSIRISKLKLKKKKCLYL